MTRYRISPRHAVAPRPARTAATVLAICLSTATGAAAQDAAYAGQPELAEVAAFDHQVTGVTVSAEGRIFVNFPRWTEDVATSVAEVVDGEARPYPDAEWNGWSNLRSGEVSAGDHFVSVQSVVADGRGSLWVLDPAAPATGFVVAGGPKLVEIDLATDAVVRVIPFGPDVAPQGSYLNDVRFAPDGSHAYITDSGPADALIVVDLETGTGRRVLEDHVSVRADPEVTVSHDGEPVRRPDNRGATFAADSIALSQDGGTLFWKPLTGTVLYSIPTDVLDDASLSRDAVAAEVLDRGEVGVTDGLWLDEQGRIYLSSVQDDAVRRWDEGEVSTVLQDDRLRWPDTFSEGPDGAIYVTTSRIMDMPWYEPENPQVVATHLWKFDPGD